MRNLKITWHLNRGCNFNCSYCYIRNMENKMSMLGHGISVDLPAFKRIYERNGIDVINLTGGEPFLYPEFVTLCEELTKFTDIRINTNLSTMNVFDFADTIDPDKVREIHVSLHIGERENVYKMVDKIHYLRSKGFNVFVSQVMHPTLFYEYNYWHSYLLKEGIVLNPKVFEGIYKFREYPKAYSKSERDIILAYANQCEKDGERKSKYSTMVHGRLSWEGHVCSYGYDSFIVQYNGDVLRCQGIKEVMGNIYGDGRLFLYPYPDTCTAKICKCEAEGWEGTGEQVPKQLGENVGRILHPYILKATRIAKEVMWKK